MQIGVEKIQWMGENYLIHLFDYETEHKKYLIWGLTIGILKRAYIEGNGAIEFNISTTAFTEVVKTRLTVHLLEWAKHMLENNGAIKLINLSSSLEDKAVIQEGGNDRNR